MILPFAVHSMPRIIFNVILNLTPAYLKPFHGSFMPHRTIFKCFSLSFSKATVICPELVYPTPFQDAVFKTH